MRGWVFFQQLQGPDMLSRSLSMKELIIALRAMIMTNAPSAGIWSVVCGGRILAPIAATDPIRTQKGEGFLFYSLPYETSIRILVSICIYCTFISTH